MFFIIQKNELTLLSNPYCMTSDKLHDQDKKCMPCCCLFKVYCQNNEILDIRLKIDPELKILENVCQRVWSANCIKTKFRQAKLQLLDKERESNLKVIFDLSTNQPFNLN